MSAENPILNSPYVEPLLHYNTDSHGALDYTDIRKVQRINLNIPNGILLKWQTTSETSRIK